MRPIVKEEDSSRVLEVQRFLTAHRSRVTGRPFLAMDDFQTNPGYFGNNTQAALRQFAAESGITGLTAAERNGTQVTERLLQAMIALDGPNTLNGQGAVYYMNPNNRRLYSEPRDDASGSDRRAAVTINNDRPVIVIDAGHGVEKINRGTDYGNARGDITEAEINYNMSSMLAQRLARQGFNVIITRDVDGEHGEDLPDVRDGFEFRWNAGRRDNVVAYVSLHSNSAEDSRVSGARVYIDRRNPDDSVSEQLARAIARDSGNGDPLVTRDRNNNIGVVNDGSGWSMISPRELGTSIPAVLVEMGFMTNWRDFQRLNPENRHTREWRQGFADSLANDITRFYTNQGNGHRLQALIGTPGRAPAPPLPVARATRDADSFYYTVQRGEGYYGIAQEFGIEVAELQAANPNAGMLSPEEEIRIPDFKNFRVRSGENMSDLVRRAYGGVREGGLENYAEILRLGRELARLNDIENVNEISAGDEIGMPRTLYALRRLADRDLPE